jgi:diguanylate cyclase (GGDEF)-like protein
MDDHTAAHDSTSTGAAVLVIDQDPTTLQVAQQALSPLGIAVHGLTRAADVDAALAAHSVSLLILNVVLPDADGRMLLARLKQQSATAAIPAFVVLGFFGPQPQDECIRLGAAEVILKPIDPDQLARLVSIALHHSTDATPDPLHDELTGLPNRAAFAEAFAREIAEIRRGGPPLSIALVDIDRLAAINDAHGRALGDIALRNAGTRLGTALRDSDLIARWEADEFAVLFPGTDLTTAARALTKAQAVFAATPVVQERGTSFDVTFSAGVTPVPAHASLEEALATADRALLRSRTAGPSSILAAEDDATDAKPTILVAEDDRVAAALVRHRLERAGFVIVHCANGQEAFETALETDLALCILDIRMPGMDGFELLKRLRESPRHGDTPILMLTSLGREEDIVRGLQLGANDYVTKPFSPVELLARVQRLLRRPGATP